jgi:uncharacterized integral membrane protein
MSASGKSQQVAGSARKASPRTIAAAVLGGLVVLFAVVNLQTVTIHWIVTTSDTPLIVVIVGCGLIGYAAGWLMARRASQNKGS